MNNFIPFSDSFFIHQICVTFVKIPLFIPTMLKTVKLKTFFKNYSESSGVCNNMEKERKKEKLY